MLIVTGGAGFIGSNIVKKLNEQGRVDIIVVDDLEDGHKFKNLADLKIADYFDKEDFIEKIKSGNNLGLYVEAVFHQGACSTTTEWNGRYMMENNFTYSKILMNHCLHNKVPFLYASSAAVYGGNQIFKEEPEFESPLNVYGYSKLLFDQYVRKCAADAESQVVGFRYFNVYGPREDHKGSMASVAFHLNNQVQKSEQVVKLFAGCDGYGDGEQKRDFVYVDDVVDVNLWFWQSGKSGIFNVGTGKSQPFNDVAKSVLAWHKTGKLEYIPFPHHLKGCYQSYTQADISALRAAGYDGTFKTVEEGVAAYLDIQNKES